MKPTKLKNEPIVYSKEALAFFQEQNDQVEFMTEPTNGNYIDYLLGDTPYNAYEGTTMDTEFDELDESSDWFMD
jgi:adenine specific DNA methylase Mod